jgi:hypothetical protein
MMSPANDHNPRNERPAVKTQHCESCLSAIWPAKSDRLLCKKLHKPRFFMPTDPHGDNGGWKRRCGDFKPVMKGQP